MDSQKPIIECKGLATNPNPLIIGDGWLEELDNMVLTRPGLAQSRRGRAFVDDLGGRHNKLFAYDGRLLAHWNDDALARLDGGVYSNLTGTATPWAGYRIQGCVAGDNFYLADAAKLKKVSGTSAAIETAGACPALSFDRGRPTKTTTAISRTAGIVTATFATHTFRAGQYLWKTTNTVAFPSGLKKILAVTAATVTYEEAGAGGPEVAHDFQWAALGETAGWLPDGEQAAYRYVLFKRDTKKNLIESAVSGRLVISNTSVTIGYDVGQARNTIVDCILPADVTTDYFIQLYRSSSVVVGTNPSDDLQLVYEAPVSDEDVRSRRTQIRDIVPDGLKGDFIYTAPNARPNGGIAASKERPPAVFDVALFKNRLFGANIIGRQRFVLSILSVGGTEGIQDGDAITFQGLTVTARAVPTLETTEFTLVTSGSAAQNNEATALNLVACINRSSTTYQARYLSSTEDFIAKVEISTVEPSGTPFQVLVEGVSKRACYSPVLGMNDTNMVAAADRVGTLVTVTFGTALRAGEKITISAATGGLSSGQFTLVSVSPTAFQYNDTVSGAVVGANVTVATVQQAQSAGDVKPNRVVISNFGEMEAFTVGSFLDVGPADATLLKLAAADDQLVAFTSAGAYRIVPSGGFFEAERVDQSLQLFGPETVRTLNGVVLAWTNRGVVSVSGMQVTSLSLDIDKSLIEWFAPKSLGNLAQDAFAVAYEPDQQYHLWLPNDDAYATCNEAYILHLADARPRWSRWTFPTNPSCGVYNPADGLWYYAGREGGVNDSFLFKERKSYNAGDFEDDLDNGGGPAEGISRRVTFVAQTASAPARMKRWDEVAILLAAGGAQDVSVSFTPDDGALAGTDTFGSISTSELRTYVRKNAARCVRLRVTIEHSRQGQSFDVAGLAISFEVLGNQVRP